MTKQNFKSLVASLLAHDIKGAGESDSQTAKDIRSLDPVLAGLVQQLADTKLAIHKHLTDRTEG